MHIKADKYLLILKNLLLFRYEFNDFFFIIIKNKFFIMFNNMINYVYLIKMQINSFIKINLINLYFIAIT